MGCRYFEEEVEAEMFDKDGLRVKRRAVDSGGGLLRGVEYTHPIPKEQKKVRDFTYAERAIMKRTALVKAMIMGLDGRGATRADFSRCFAVACSNAGP